MPRRRHLLAAPALLALPGLAQGQAPWPSRPVRLINPYAPGGTSDIIVRPLAERLQTRFGQPFIVENRAGAGGTIGTAAAAAERPDGYTLLVSNTGPLAVAPALFPSLPYDPNRAFTWITMLGGAPIVCAVKGDGPIRTMADYIATARRRPDEVSFGSSGVGSAGHLTGVLFGMETGTTLLHVPFRGAGEAQQAVLGGQTTSLWDTSGANAAAIRAGNLRGIAVSSAERIAALPDVPTVRELGLPGVVSTNWFLVCGPAGLDPAIAARLGAAFREILAEPATRERLENVGVVPLGTPTPAEIAGFVAQEGARWGHVVRTAGVRPS
ncbi:MAG: tripartite tricarboxylate transporter substrate binding protein [Acetobacteraceae bacterium]|nr:tripartite tricarboxylate transporter substrate binding protein [Acetobacteraceae bacterium]